MALSPIAPQPAAVQAVGSASWRRSLRLFVATRTVFQLIDERRNETPIEPAA